MHAALRPCDRPCNAANLRAMLGPKPQVIADDTWAKILWAGLNLEADDLADAGIRAYPLEPARALTLTWLFADQRSDEILRLRVGCVRRQQSDGADPATPVCLLDIPVHKTGPRSPSRSILSLGAASKRGRRYVQFNRR